MGPKTMRFENEDYSLPRYTDPEIHQLTPKTLHGDFFAIPTNRKRGANEKSRACLTTAMIAYLQEAEHRHRMNPSRRSQILEGVSGFPWDCVHLEYHKSNLAQFKKHKDWETLLGPQSAHQYHSNHHRRGSYQDHGPQWQPPVGPRAFLSSGGTNNHVSRNPSNPMTSGSSIKE